MKYCTNCGKELTDDMYYCPSCGTSAKKVVTEEFSVNSEDLVKRIKDLIHEGNVNKIIVRNERDETLLEIPATVGLVGTLIAPWLAALGVIAALATRCKIVVERKEA